MVIPRAIKGTMDAVAELYKLKAGSVVEPKHCLGAKETIDALAELYKLKADSVGGTKARLRHEH